MDQLHELQNKVVALTKLYLSHHDDMETLVIAMFETELTRLQNSIVRAAHSQLARNKQAFLKEFGDREEENQND
jgi:hypothetical protein